HRKLQRDNFQRIPGRLRILAWMGLPAIMERTAKMNESSFQTLLKPCVRNMVSAMIDLKLSERIPRMMIMFIMEKKRWLAYRCTSDFGGCMVFMKGTARVMAKINMQSPISRMAKVLLPLLLQNSITLISNMKSTGIRQRLIKKRLEQRGALLWIKLMAPGSRIAGI